MRTRLAYSIKRQHVAYSAPRNKIYRKGLTGLTRLAYSSKRQHDEKIYRKDVNGVGTVSAYSQA